MSELVDFALSQDQQQTHKARQHLNCPEGAAAETSTPEGCSACSANIRFGLSRRSGSSQGQAFGSPQLLLRMPSRNEADKRLQPRGAVLAGTILKGHRPSMLGILNRPWSVPAMGWKQILTAQVRRFLDHHLRTATAHCEARNGKQRSCPYACSTCLRCWHATCPFMMGPQPLRL